MDAKELQVIVANAPKSLYDAQKQYSEWHEHLKTARDLAADAEIEYEIAYANFIRDNTKDASNDRTITVLKEHAKAHCAEQLVKRVRAEVNVKKCIDAIAHQEQRLNTAKAFLRLDFGKAQV